MPQNNLRPVMALLFVGVLMGALDLAVIGPALPAIQAQFGLDNRSLSWLFNVYVLAQLIGTPLFAKASDRYGRRSIYMGCVTAFGLGSLMLVVATNYETLLVGRTVQGLGASGIFPVAAAVIGDSFPKEKQGGALGLIGAVFGLAFLIGPVLGGILLRYSWEWLFLINLPIAAGLLLGAWRLLPGGRNRDQLPFDWAGACLLTLSLLGIAIAVTNLDTGRLLASLASWSVGPFIVAGLALLPLWWRIEQRASDPIVRPSFFSGRQIRIVMLVAAGIGMVECAQVFFPALGVAALGISESTAAWLMLPGVFVMVLVSPLAGKLVDGIGAARVIQVSLAVILAGLLVYALADINYVTFIGGGMIVGVGIAALLGAPLRYVVLEEARPEDRASTQGLLNIFLAIGQLTGAAIVGAVATSAGGGTGGYQASLGVLAAITLAVGLPALALRQKAPTTV